MIKRYEAKINIMIMMEEDFSNVHLRIEIGSTWHFCDETR